MLRDRSGNVSRSVFEEAAVAEGFRAFDRSLRRAPRKYHPALFDSSTERLHGAWCRTTGLLIRRRVARSDTLIRVRLSVFSSGNGWQRATNNIAGDMCRAPACCCFSRPLPYICGLIDVSSVCDLPRSACLRHGTRAARDEVRLRIKRERLMRQHFQVLLRYRHLF